MTARILKSITMISACMALLAPSISFSDPTYDKNQAANRLYKQGKYDQALKLYDEAGLADPQNPRLKMNKGSAHYKMGQFDQAEQAYSQAQTEKDRSALADLHYNLANALFRQGQKSMMQAGGEASGAQEKFKGALDNYIKALDNRPSDRDAKWNLQITQQVLEELKKQQQNQQQNKDQKQQDQKQNQDQQQKQDQKQDQKQQDQKQQDQKQQDQKQDQKQQDQKQQDQKQQQQKQQQQQPMPQPQQSKEELKKEEARKLLELYSDDDDKLNKPVRIGVVREKRPEKDW